MQIIGITGGVGSGKSRVLGYMEQQHGAYICQADHVAWELQLPGEGCYEKIVQTFGREIVQEDGRIDRPKLGSIVFGDAEKLQVLNDIMHPAVKEEIRRRIQKQEETGTTLFVLEAALLIEEGYGEICKELWYLHVDRQVRIKRLLASRPYTREKIEKMMASQLSEEAYVAESDRVIENSGTFEETCRQIEKALKELETT